MTIEERVGLKEGERMQFVRDLHNIKDYRYIWIFDENQELVRAYIQFFRNKE